MMNRYHNEICLFGLKYCSNNHRTFFHIESALKFCTNLWYLRSSVHHIFVYFENNLIIRKLLILIKMIVHYHCLEYLMMICNLIQCISESICIDILFFKHQCLIVMVFVSIILLKKLFYDRCILDFSSSNAVADRLFVVKSHLFRKF